MNNHNQELFIDYIKQLLYNTDEATLNRKDLSIDNERLADGLEYLGEVIKDEKRVLDDMALGNIDTEFKISHNFLAAPVKSIQSNLRHLTWVAGRVSEGDYSQRVSSLGRFSDSFNEMTDQLRQYRDKMEYISNTDSLTGVGNRRAFNQMIESLWQRNINCTIAFIDLDGLKYCNDNYGHSEGDNYINTVCVKLSSILQKKEYLFRLGGDEFLILSLTEDAQSCEKRLLNAYVEYSDEMRNKVSYSTGFSFGCVDVVKLPDKTISEYLSLADKKMYHFKMKKYSENKNMNLSHHLDKTGLNNRVFEIFSKMKNNRYTFLSNLDTNVSRWSVDAVKEFQLPCEYLLNEKNFFKEYIFTEDFDSFVQSVKAVVSGESEILDINLRLKNKEGIFKKCHIEGDTLIGRTKEEANLLIGIITIIDED